MDVRELRVDLMFHTSVWKQTSSAERNLITVLKNDFRNFHIVHEGSVSTAMIYQLPTLCCACVVFVTCVFFVSQSSDSRGVVIREEDEEDRTEGRTDSPCFPFFVIGSRVA